MIFVADAGWPSCRTPSALISHRSPSRVQYPSPKPPSESKIQVLNWCFTGVPSDPLRAAEDRLALGLHGEFADQEVAVVGPLAGGVDDCVLALVDPVPDQPFQLLEAVVGAQVMGELVADGGLEPLAVFLDVDDGEASDLGHRTGPGRRDGRPPLLECRVGAEEAQGVHLDRDRAAGGFGERRGELSADGGAALGPLAVLVNDQGILCKSRRGGGGVALIECLCECRDEIGDRLFIVAEICRPSWRPKGAFPSARIPGRPGPGKSRARARPATDRRVSFLSLLFTVRGQRLAVLDRRT